MEECIALPPSVSHGFLLRWWSWEGAYSSAPLSPDDFTILSEAKVVLPTSTRFEILSAYITPPTPGLYVISVTMSGSGETTWTTANGSVVLTISDQNPATLQVTEGDTFLMQSTMTTSNAPVNHIITWILPDTGVFL